MAVRLRDLDHRRGPLWAVAAICLVLLVGGCAQPGNRPGTPSRTAPATGDAGPATGGAGPVTYGADQVTAVRRGPTPDTLLIDVKVLDGCYRNLRAEKQDEGPDGRLFIDVLFEGAQPTSSPAPGASPACATYVTATVTFTFPGPVGDRPLTVAGTAFAVDGAGYRRCDATLGCTPPADHCASQWWNEAKSQLDIPAHVIAHTEYCDQAWMAVTVDVNAAACGAAPRPGCSAPPNVSRYVMRFNAEPAPGQWRLVSRTKGGCAEVKAKAPDFPDAACQKLTAID